MSSVFLPLLSQTCWPDTDSSQISLIHPKSLFGFSSLLFVPKLWQSHLVSGFLVNVCASNQNLFVYWSLGIPPPPTTDCDSVSWNGLKWRWKPIIKMSRGALTAGNNNNNNENNISANFNLWMFCLIHWRQTSVSSYFYMTCWYLVVYQHVVEVQTRQGGLLRAAGPTKSSWSWVRQ